MQGTRAAPGRAEGKPSYCHNCGVSAPYGRRHPIDEALQRAWGLSAAMTELFNRREGSFCPNCGANLRAQGLARAILDSEYGFGQRSLKAWVKAANAARLAVCELNKCHQLHDTLCALENLTYAEYGTSIEQNIERMTYQSNGFDLFLHSETIEHVNDPAQAAEECRRVIKPGGLVLFTTPVIWNRTTRRRARLDGDQVHHLLEPSYHGRLTADHLVFHEYGRDLDAVLGASLNRADWRNQNFVFSSRKAPSKIRPATKLRLVMLERIAEARTVLSRGL
jgi:SAM-dependent methyltransferase